MANREFSEGTNDSFYISSNGGVGANEISIRVA
jgi:hypothetical protein